MHTDLVFLRWNYCRVISHKKKQRTKINQAYSSWEKILFRIFQGSILGPILLKIFLSVMFLVVQNVDFASYADDNAIYDAGDNINEVIFSLQKSKRLFKCFADNGIKINEDKCQLIRSTNELTEIQIADFSIENSAIEKLLGVSIDSKLKFKINPTKN